MCYSPKEPRKDKNCYSEEKPVLSRAFLFLILFLFLNWKYSKLVFSFQQPSQSSSVDNPCS